MAFVLIIILMPILIIIFLVIYVEDGMPIFFIQKRVGLNNKYFNIYKFRTMKVGTPNIESNLLTNHDQYILKFGTFLRKNSLDELPNLFNILNGDMVFVGPRPALYNQTDLVKLRNSLDIQKIKPGITGLAQINGRDNISNEKKVEYDKEYLYNKSLILDLRIILHTFIRVILRKNISH